MSNQMPTVDQIVTVCDSIKGKLSNAYTAGYNKGLAAGGSVENLDALLKEEFDKGYDDGFAAGKNYKPLAFTISFYISSTTVFEKGATCKSVTFAWLLNKTPTSLKIAGNTVSNSATTRTISGSWTTNATFAFEAKFENEDLGISETVPATASIYFRDTVYYGCATEPTGGYTSKWILDNVTSKKFTAKLSDQHIQFTGDPEDSEYRYYCVPASWNNDTGTTSKLLFAPTVGMATAFERFYISAHTNASGKDVGKYIIYRSLNPGGSSQTFTPSIKTQ